MNKKHTRKRLLILCLIISLFLILFLVRAIKLVTEDRDTYLRKALTQATGTSSTIKSKPGSIYDANGTTLATVNRVYRLILDPKVLKETEEDFEGSFDQTIEILAEAFGLDREDLEKTFRENETSSYLRYEACPILSEEQVDVYNALADDFKEEKEAHNKKVQDKELDEDPIKAKVAGVWFEEEYRRYYPLDSTLSKVVGYTTKDAETGILGLEYEYNDVLHGTDGRTYTYVDEDGSIMKEVDEAENGLSLVTSLDSNVSRIVQNCIQNFQQTTGAERITVLVMDPNDASIIAMESSTEFDLNNPSDLTALFTEEELENPAETFLLKEAFKGKTEELEAMTLEEQLEALTQQVQQNYAVSGTFEPGSTAKTLTLAAALESGSVAKDDLFNCTGEIQVDRYTIHCHMDTLCGDLTPMEALGRSCNVCFVQIASATGAETFSEFQKLFNIGQKTGIDLPGEADTSSLYYSADRMGEVELATCAFGQGFNTTMVQMAAAYASILNGGYYYKPHVVTRIVDDGGNTVEEIQPELVRRTVSEETSDYLKECLRYVVLEGTATETNTFGYYLGGKTGASEKLPRGTGDYVISFIGAAPIENPKFLIYVAIDTPHVEDQSFSNPAQELAKACFDGLYGYFGIYSAMDDDAADYDWSNLRDSSQDSDAAHNEADISDPNDLEEWISQHETESIASESPVNDPETGEAAGAESLPTAENTSSAESNQAEGNVGEEAQNPETAEAAGAENSLEAGSAAGD